MQPRLPRLGNRLQCFLLVGLISSPNKTAGGPSLQAPLHGALGTCGSSLTIGATGTASTGAGAKHSGGSAGSTNTGLGRQARQRSRQRSLS